MLDDWHYLGATCRGVMIALGHDEGCCVFTNPRSRMIARWFPDLKMIELARMVGKPNHEWAMTSLMSLSLKEVKRQGWDVVITYADPVAGHNGAVYRAGNWTFCGMSTQGHGVWYLDGKRVSPRSFYDRHGTQARKPMLELYGDRLRIDEEKAKPRFLMGLSKSGIRAVKERIQT